MAIAQTHMTLDEFLLLPEEKPALEFADGMVSQKVSPKGKHSSLQYGFAAHINRQAVERRLAKAFPELRATFSGRSHVPDVAVYRWDRIPRDPDGTVANDFFEPPDIAVEIVSPDQSVIALVRKCGWYVENGVTIAMLVDPAEKSMVVMRPGQVVSVLSGDDQIPLDDVLEDVELTVRQVFDSLFLD